MPVLGHVLDPVPGQMLEHVPKHVPEHVLTRHVLGHVLVLIFLLPENIFPPRIF